MSSPIYFKQPGANPRCDPISHHQMGDPMIHGIQGVDLFLNCEFILAANITGKNKKHLPLLFC